MPQETDLVNERPIPASLVSDGADRIPGSLQGMPEEQRHFDPVESKTASGMDEIFDVITSGLYNLASMLVGEGDAGAELVETAIANTEISVCHDPEQARKSSRHVLSAAALEILQRRDPGCLAPPQGLTPAGSCIEDDHIEVARAAGVELERMIAGPDRERVRKWLASLPASTRTVFVLCAIAGLSSNETAKLLASHGGPQAAGWTAEAVHIVFLRGLCSLASQLLQTLTVK